MAIGIQRGYAGIQSNVYEAMRILNHLRPVDLRKVNASDRVCAICFDTESNPRANRSCHELVRLPGCGHYFGRSCIVSWLTPFDKTDPELSDSDSVYKSMDIFFNWQKTLYEAESMVADATQGILLPPPGTPHGERQRLKRDGKLLHLGLLIYGPHEIGVKAHYEVGTNTCPLCTKVLFPKPLEGEGLIPLLARIRVWDAAYQALNLSRLPEEEAYRTEALTFLDTWQKHTDIHRQIAEGKEKPPLDSEYHHGFVLAMASLIDIRRRPQRYEYLKDFPDRCAQLASFGLSLDYRKEDWPIWYGGAETPNSKCILM
ncbi:MAG: hypothetical protein Q9222_006569 [Ikaeria aurantiellina]